MAIMKLDFLGRAYNGGFLTTWTCVRIACGHCFGDFNPNLRCFQSMIKTHDSESRGQEEAGLRDERVSYLQVAPL